MIELLIIANEKRHLPAFCLIRFRRINLGNGDAWAHNDLLTWSVPMEWSQPITWPAELGLYFHSYYDVTQTHQAFVSKQKQKQLPTASEEDLLRMLMFIILVNTVRVFVVGLLHRFTKSIPWNTNNTCKCAVSIDITVLRLVMTTISCYPIVVVVVSFMSSVQGWVLSSLMPLVLTLLP